MWVQRTVESSVYSNFVPEITCSAMEKIIKVSTCEDRCVCVNVSFQNSVMETREL